MEKGEIWPRVFRCTVPKHFRSQIVTAWEEERKEQDHHRPNLVLFTPWSSLLPEKGGVRTDFIQTKYYDWPSSFETGSFSSLTLARSKRSLVKETRRVPSKRGEPKGGAQGLMIQKLCFFIYCNIAHPLECSPTLFTSDLPNTLNVSSARDPCSFLSVSSFFPILPSSAGEDRNMGTDRNTLVICFIT